MQPYADEITTILLPSVGVFKNGRVEIIANDQGNRITPSYVAFTPEGERLIGDAAKNQLTSNPENTVFDAKRLIGRTWNDPSVQQDIKYLPFKVCQGFPLGSDASCKNPKVLFLQDWLPPASLEFILIVHNDWFTHQTPFCWGPGLLNLWLNEDMDPV